MKPAYESDCRRKQSSSWIDYELTRVHPCDPDAACEALTEMYTIIRDGKILEKEKLAEKLNAILENAQPYSLRVKGHKLEAVLSLPESRTFIHTFTPPHYFKGTALERFVFDEAENRLHTAKAIMALTM
ncbi:MAG: hypothetical protein IH819_11915 [Bacteroidetes bacterium]|nr:hypothetical protein [Bacteroidota bacterium]